MNQARPKKRCWSSCAVLIVLAGFVLDCASAEAVTVNLVMTVQTVSYNAGTNNATLEVTLTNNGGSNVTVGGFSFGISVATTDINFTSANTTTTASYVFSSSSLFGPTISVQPPTLPGQALNAEDISSNVGVGAIIGPGATVGVGHVLFNVSPSAGTEGVPVTLSSAICSVSSVNGGTIPFSQVNGTINVTPAAQALAATINDSVTGTGLNQFEYVGPDWHTATVGGPQAAYQNDEHYAFVTNTIAHFRFSGTQVKIYTTKEPAGGNIGYSIDGMGEAPPVSNYAPTSMGNQLSYTSPILANGTHDLVIRVVGSHEASATSNTITVDKAEVYVPAGAQVLAATINDSVTGTGTNQFDYVGSDWHQTAMNPSTGAYQNDEHYAFVTNTMAHFRFHGSQVKIYTTKEPAGGNIGYTIDTQPEAPPVSNYSATSMGNQLSYTSPVLSDGDHDLVIRVVGTHEASATSNTITLDKAEVYSPGQVATATINDSVTGTGDSQFNYVGADWHTAMPGASTGAYLNDEHYAFVTNTIAHFRFNGTQVKIYTVKEPVGGNIGYTLDGGMEQTVSNYAPTSMGNQLSYTSPVNMPAGEHDLVIRVVGSHEPAATSNTITIDKAEIYGGASGPVMSAQPASKTTTSTKKKRHRR